MGLVLPFAEDRAAASRTLWHEDASDGSITIETSQDVAAIVEHAKGLYNLHDERTRWAGDGGQNQVASIPMPIYMDLYRRGIATDKKALAAWLNDSDNRAFRTRPGRV